MTDAPLVPPTPELLAGTGGLTPDDIAVILNTSARELNHALDIEEQQRQLTGEPMANLALPVMLYSPLMRFLHDPFFMAAMFPLLWPYGIWGVWSLIRLACRLRSVGVYLANALISFAIALCYLGVAGEYRFHLWKIWFSGIGLPIDILSIAVLAFSGFAFYNGVQYLKTYREVTANPPYLPSPEIMASLQRLRQTTLKADVGADPGIIACISGTRMRILGDYLFVYRFHHRDEVTITPTGYSTFYKAMRVDVSLGMGTPFPALMYGLCYVRYLHWKGEELP